MKIFLFLILLLIFQDIPAIITEYNSSNRLILIFSSDNQSGIYNRALLEIARDPLGMDQRAVLIFEVFITGGIHPDGSPISEPDAERLWNYYDIQGKEFMIVLLNKDSLEIFRSEEPMKAAEIITAFDNEKI